MLVTQDRQEKLTDLFLEKFTNQLPFNGLKKMQKMKKEVVKKAKDKVVSWDKHLDKKYGLRGITTRSEFETKSQTFILGELLKEEREKANLTQAEMAEKTGTKKSYISRIENGRADIQLSTLYKLIEQGLNRKLELTIH